MGSCQPLELIVPDPSLELGQPEAFLSRPLERVGGGAPVVFLLPAHTTRRINNPLPPRKDKLNEGG